MQSRISSESETDAYKQALYPVLRTLSQEVLTRFNGLLTATSEKERDVRKFNLFGFNGRVKKVRGRYPFVPRLRPTTTYKYANFGDLLKVLKQRCEYISTREVPQRYVDDVEQGAAFTKLRSEVTEFLNYLKNTVDARWSEAVTQARTAGGQQVQQNLERRAQPTERTPRPQQNNRGRGAGRGRGGPTRGRQFTQRTGQSSEQNSGQNSEQGAGVAAAQRGRGFVRGRGRATGAPRQERTYQARSSNL
jgi:hypothetical protein